MQINLTIILLTASLIASIGLLGKMGCDRHELTQANDQLNKELMQANEATGRALTKFGDARAKISDLEEDQKAEIKARKGWVTRYAQLNAQYKLTRKQLKGQKAQIIYIEGETIKTEREFIAGMHYEAITNKTLVPIKYLTGTYSDYHIKIDTKITPIVGRYRDVEFEFDYQLTMSFDLQFVETRLPSGAINHYAKMWEVNSKTKERVSELEIANFEVIVEKPKGKKWFWAPHVDIGGIAGIKLMSPNINAGWTVGFTPFGYGLTVNDLDWRVLRISLDLSEYPGVGISPIVYNLAQNIPIVSNVWIGPHINYMLFNTYSINLCFGAIL